MVITKGMQWHSKIFAFETFKDELANVVKAISDNILKFDCEKCGKTNPDENCKYFEVLNVINVKLNAT